MKQKPFKPDRPIILNFVAFLSSIERRIENELDWPEDTGLNEQPDAIAGQLVIEHTSIDVLPNQREHEHWFHNVVQGLEETLRPILTTRYMVIFPYDGVVRGQDWTEMREALRIWLESTASKLADGNYESLEIKGLPFKISLRKGGDFLARKLLFARTMPQDRTFDDRLLTQVCRKLRKLRPHREIGRQTLLLLQSNDISLMSHGLVMESLDRVLPKWPDELDEIWFAHVWDEDITSYCELRSRRIWMFDTTKQLLIRS